MKRIKQLTWGSKRRKVAATLTTFALIGGVALGWYLINVGVTGSGQTTLPTAPSGTDVTLSAVTMPSNLLPGQSGPITATLNSTNPSQVIIPASAFAAGAQFVDNHDSQCLNAWFEYTPPTANVIVAPGVTTGQDIGTMKFADSGTDQSVCEGSTLTLSFVNGVGNP